MHRKIPMGEELHEQYRRLEPRAQATLLYALDWWEAAQNALTEYHTPTTDRETRYKALIIELWGQVKELAEHAAWLERQIDDNQSRALDE